MRRWQKHRVVGSLCSVLFPGQYPRFWKFLSSLFFFTWLRSLKAVHLCLKPQWWWSTWHSTSSPLIPAAACIWLNWKVFVCVWHLDIWRGFPIILEGKWWSSFIGSWHLCTVCNSARCHAVNCVFAANTLVCTGTVVCPYIRTGEQTGFVVIFLQVCECVIYRKSLNGSWTARILIVVSHSFIQPTSDRKESTTNQISCIKRQELWKRLSCAKSKRWPLRAALKIPKRPEGGSFYRLQTVTAAKKISVYAAIVAVFLRKKEQKQQWRLFSADDIFLIHSSGKSLVKQRGVSLKVMHIWCCPLTHSEPWAASTGNKISVWTI